MSIDNIGLDPEMDGHDFNMRMWKWENPSFPAYYEFSSNGERKRYKDKVKSIQRKMNAKLR